MIEANFGPFYKRSNSFVRRSPVRSLTSALLSRSILFCLSQLIATGTYSLIRTSAYFRNTFIVLVAWSWDAAAFESWTSQLGNSFWNLDMAEMLDTFTIYNHRGCRGAHIGMFQICKVRGILVVESLTEGSNRFVCLGEIDLCYLFQYRLFCLMNYTKKWFGW